MFSAFNINTLRRLLKVRHSEFVVSVAETFATRIFAILTGLVVSVLVTRALGPEGRGVYAMAMALWALGTQFANLGVQSSNVYVVSKQPHQLPHLIGNSLWLGALFGFMAAAFIALVGVLFPQWLPVKGMVLWLTLGLIPIGLATMFLQNLLIGLNKIRLNNFIELASKLVGFLATAGLWFASAISVLNLLVLLCLSSVGMLGAVFILLRRISASRSRISGALFKAHFSYGLKVYTAGLFMYLVLKIDLFMVDYFLGKSAAGFYSLSVSLAEMLTMLPVIAGTLMFPRLSALATDIERWGAFKRVFAGVGVLMLVAIGAAGLLGPWAITRLYGVVFTPSIAPFLWLLPAVLFISLNGILMNFLASINLPRITVYSPLLGCILNILLNLLWIPKFGIIGAAWASVFSYGFMLMFAGIYCYKRFELSPPTEQVG